MTRLTVSTWVGVSLAAFGVALTFAGYELSQHALAADSASIAAGALVFVGYLLVVTALLILVISALMVILRGAHFHQHS